MPRVAYQPCSDPASQRNLKATIHTRVHLDELTEFLSDADLAILHERHPDGYIHFWGVTPNRNTLPAWGALSPGDVSIFNIKTLFSITGVVTHKLQNRALAAHFWGWHTEENSYTWEHIYFLEQVTRIAVPYAVALEGSSSSPQRSFNLLSQENSDIVIDNMNIGDSIAGILSSPKLAEVRNEIDAGSVDGKTETSTRKEHRFIVDHLFGNRTEIECSICGKPYPRTYLVAAHIKKRSRCSTDEKKDVEHIATPMCTFGCDRLFETGLVSVDPKGIVISHPDGIEHPQLSDYISNIEGRLCKAFNKKNQKYFRWHRKEHGFEAM